MRERATSPRSCGLDQLCISIFFFFFKSNLGLN